MICLLDFTTIMRLSFYHIFEFYILPHILYTGCGLKRVCHNPRTLNNKHPSMHIIVIKSETHPLHPSNTIKERILFMYNCLHLSDLGNIYIYI
jgi:hypothetical protein